jgi:hypothetical protein
MLGCQVFGIQPKVNEMAALEVSPNHFQIPLVVE